MSKYSLMVLPEFLERAASLSKQSKSKLVRILHTLSKDYRHPSLQCKKVKGTKAFLYECRVDRGIRLIYDVGEGCLRCWYVGKHEQALGFATERSRKSQESIVDDIEIKDVSKDIADIIGFLTFAQTPNRFRPIDLNQI